MRRGSLAGGVWSVSSVIGYDDVADAIRLAALARIPGGHGGDNDAEVARELVTGLPPSRPCSGAEPRGCRTSTATGHRCPTCSWWTWTCRRWEELGGCARCFTHAADGYPGSPNMLTPSLVSGTPARTSISGAPLPQASGHVESRRCGHLDLRQVTLADITAFANSTGTPSMRTPTRKPRLLTRSSRDCGSRLLLLSWAAGLFVSPEPDLCWPTTAGNGPVHQASGSRDSIRVTLTAKKITAVKRKSTVKCAGRSAAQPGRRDCGHVRRADTG